MKKIVVISGAGISKESGIQTFRDSKDSLWNNYKIEDVATIEAWRKQPDVVLDFYNQRRKQLQDVEPNDAHFLISKLESKYNVNIITQNVDDLHERAGSTNILHLHGELTKAQSSLNPNIIKDIGYEEINIGDKCEKGSQLRPHIVWFGELVPKLSKAKDIVYDADILIIVGTSFTVYPAASLMTYSKSDTPIYIIDPGSAPLKEFEIYGYNNNISKANRYVHYMMSATVGMKILFEELMSESYEHQNI